MDMNEQQGLCDALQRAAQLGWTLGQAAVERGDIQNLTGLTRITKQLRYLTGKWVLSRIGVTKHRNMHKGMARAAFMSGYKTAAVTAMQSQGLI